MMMRHLVGLLLVAVGACAWSQATSGPEVESLDAQMARIESTRQRMTAELDAQDLACQSKFAATDCHNQVSARRRATLGDLKRQEISVNALQRKQRGADQLQRSEEKAAERDLREKQAESTPERQSADDRKKTQEEKVLNHHNQATRAPDARPASKAGTAIDAQAVEQKRQAFQEKQTALEKRRQERDKRLLDQGTSGPPLPVAP